MWPGEGIFEAFRVSKGEMHLLTFSHTPETANEQDIYSWPANRFLSLIIIKPVSLAFTAAAEEEKDETSSDPTTTMPK